MTIQDDAANNNANAQVDGGKLRVGDGAGTISIDGTVTARQGSVPSFRQYYAEFPLNSGDCKQLADPPAGSAVVLTDIWFNVSGVGSQGDLAAIATGTCAAPGVLIAAFDATSRGGTAMPLGPGSASKTGFIVLKPTPGLSIAVTGFGYLTSAAGLP